MRRFSFLVLFALSVLGLTACGGGGSSSTSGSSGGGGGAVTSSNITLPSSVQVVSAN